MNTADKFRDMADRLATEIDHKRGNRRENTPKQRREADEARIQGRHLDRVRGAMLRLADARDAGTLPPALDAVASKAQLLTMLRTRTGSHGYYDVHDTGVYGDTTPLAVALRDWLCARPDPEAEKRDRAETLAAADRKFLHAGIDGFFPTPPRVAAKVMLLADLAPGMRVLEPSAGTGNLLAAALEVCAVHVAAVERFRPLADHLTEKFKGTAAPAQVRVFALDFLKMKPDPRADRVVMNPPFEHAADIAHVEHALKFLKPGGRLVSVVAAGPRQRERFGAGEWYDLPPDSFKESGTGVCTALVVIDK